MKSFVTMLMLVCVLNASGQISSRVPNEIDPNKKYLFYLHGAIVQNMGENAFLRPIRDRATKLMLSNVRRKFFRQQPSEILSKKVALGKILFLFSPRQ